MAEITRQAMQRSAMQRSVAAGMERQLEHKRTRVVRRCGAPPRAPPRRRADAARVAQSMRRTNDDAYDDDDDDDDNNNNDNRNDDDDNDGGGGGGASTRFSLWCDRTAPPLATPLLPLAGTLLLPRLPSALSSLSPAAAAPPRPRHPRVAPRRAAAAGTHSTNRSSKQTPCSAAGCDRRTKLCARACVNVSE